MRKFAFALAGALIGMVMVSCWIGGVIGWEQSGQWPAWLTVPMGVGTGPIYLASDVMVLLAGKPENMIALPQSLPGGLVGGIVGWLLSHIRRWPEF